MGFTLAHFIKKELVYIVSNCGNTELNGTYSLVETRENSFTYENENGCKFCYYTFINVDYPPHFMFADNVPVWRRN